MADRNSTGKGKQGFASMPKSRVQEIAAKGGRASHGGQNDSNRDKAKTESFNK